MKESQAEAEGDHGIKCKYMLSARNYLSNTTFHGIPWVLEDISKGAKVKAKTSCYSNYQTHYDNFYQYNRRVLDSSCVIFSLHGGVCELLHNFCGNNNN